ncbi:transketolase [Methanospirillum purgamenti]|uniref:transketolase n=1 Tax=Methanospirillum purgamenti TaxID=2834276 RepID=UPI0021114CDA|nr:transketolase [Methanospirillum sp. J.3.6.1-F.2.7.3]
MEEMAYRMRKKTLYLANRAGSKGAHIGSALSIIEIMAVLYGGILKIDPKNPFWIERDRFIISKGHGSLGFYTALYEAGFLSEEELDTFEENGGILPGQPVMSVEKGIEFSIGSLGHGLSLGVGVAFAGKRNHTASNVYVLMGDGECNEGSVWEAAMAAKQYHLSSITAIIDANEMQSDGRCSAIMGVNYGSLWESFGWQVCYVDGHDIHDLYVTLKAENKKETPRVIIAKTVKGKGISFMENNNAWHHNRLSDEDCHRAIEELDFSR